MAITVIAPIPSREVYETINEKMFGSKQPQVIDGLIIHTAGDGPDGFCVVDVWESRDAFDDFMNGRVMPALEEAGVPMEGTPPTIIELQNVLVNEEARV
jgi:quinol monooxygenase YgiN